MSLRTYLAVIFFPCCLLLAMPGWSYAQQGTDNTYPTPERMFYIERSKNRNIVCYDVSLTGGKLNTGKPLSVYWIDREENPGERKELSSIQRYMAYGYKLVSADDDSAEVILTAHPARKLTIRRLGGKYVCLIEIAGSMAVLQRLYVKAKESNSMSVEYVELFGMDMETLRPVNERINK